MRLAAAHLASLPANVARPQYARERCGVGIVHLGVGAFHRAHQAVFTDDVLAAEGGDWRILGVSLRSAAVQRQMVPQDGLYTLVERSGDDDRARVIGSIADVMVAPQARGRVAAALASPSTHIVSLTITEQGYCRAPGGGLDAELAGEASAYAYLAAAFAKRRDSGLPGLTLLSCDNLAENGAQLARLMSQYLEARSPDLRRWFEAECACPSTMVDRIVPATTQSDLAYVETRLGLRDEAAVVSEPFSQWVIEDRFAGPRPAWEKCGAQITTEVQAYETAKLRMLNGTHSALAYLGLRRGHEFVHQAIDDPEIAPLVERLMRVEAATSLTPAPGQDLDAYAATLIARFRNPALHHRLGQIAMDGSQKLPQRWLQTLAVQQKNGRDCPSLLTALGSWLLHVRGDNGPVDDPMADQLRAAWQGAGQTSVVDALFGPHGLMASDWRCTARERAVIEASMT